LKTFHVENAEQREELEKIRADAQKRTEANRNLKLTAALDVVIADTEGASHEIWGGRTCVFFCPTNSRNNSSPRKILYDFSTLYVALDESKVQLKCVFTDESTLVTVKSQTRIGVRSRSGYNPASFVSS
jgi:hypothetical protein